MLAMIGVIESCDHKNGSGTIVTQTRNVGTFNEVSIGGAFEVQIKMGSAAKVVIEADDNIIDYIEATVKKGQLKISLNDGLSINDAHMKVFITTTELDLVNSSASAKVVVLDEMKSDEKVVLKASSGSNISAAIISPATEADASSGAEIVVKGRTKTFKAESSSGASVKASELLSENTIAQSSSGGSTSVHASLQLNAKASSGGSITYRGEAEAVIKESSGGSITKKD